MQAKFQENEEVIMHEYLSQYPFWIRSIVIVEHEVEGGRYLVHQKNNPSKKHEVLPGDLRRQMYNS